MKCPKCNYVFSEENRVCPKCGQDMGEVLERIGLFPKASDKVFFTISDFLKFQEDVEAKEEVSSEQTSQSKKTEEISLHQEETTQGIQTLETPEEENRNSENEKELGKNIEDFTISNEESSISLQEFKVPAEEVSLPNEEIELPPSEEIELLENESSTNEDLLFPEGEITIPADNISIEVPSENESEEKQEEQEDKKEVEIPFPES